MRDLRYITAAFAYPQSLLLPSVAALAMVRLWMQAPAAGLLDGPTTLAAGLCAWTLLEYLLHRHMLHGVEPFKTWHLQHHLHPDVPMRTPVLFSLILILPVACLPVLFRAHAGPAAAFACGVLTGHVLQEIAHHRLHLAAHTSSHWLAQRWREHDDHHHRNEHLGFGTLTGFWDGVCGTRVAV